MFVLEKTTVFQLEIFKNHHGNHFHGFMALVEEKNQNAFTKFHTLVSTIKWQSIIKNQNFEHSIIPLTKLNGLWQALLTGSSDFT